MAEILYGFFPNPAERLKRSVEALASKIESGGAPDDPALMRPYSPGHINSIPNRILLKRRGELLHECNTDWLSLRSPGRQPDDVYSLRIGGYVRRDAFAAFLREIVPLLERLLAGLDWEAEQEIRRLGDAIETATNEKIAAWAGVMRPSRPSA